MCACTCMHFLNLRSESLFFMRFLHLIKNLSTRFKLAKMNPGNSIIAEISRNQLLLVNKINSLEALITPKQSAARTLPCETINQEEILAEQKKLISENAKLKEEVGKIIKRITDLEIYVKGEENVASIDLLKSSVTKETPNLQVAEVEESNNKVQVKPQIQTNLSEQASKKKDNNKKPDKKNSQNNKENKDSQPKSNQQGEKPKPQQKVQAVPDRPVTVDRLDLRVGKIIEVKRHPDADSLYIESIECGEEKPRTVVSGLVNFCQIEEMQNRSVVLLCNLKPAKMRGVTSEAMVMCASTPEKVEILSPPEGALPGERVVFDKYPGEPDSQLNPKKKIWEQIAPGLATNNEFVATYKGDPFVVAGKGVVKAQTLKNVIIK